MFNVKVLVAVLLAFTISGCGLTRMIHEDVKVPQTPAEVVVEGEKLVDEANALLLAIARVVRQKYDAGLISVEEASAYRADLLRHAQNVDRARELIKLGDLKGYNQVKLLNELLRQLQKEVARKARQA